ncbi:T-cell activation Rho GTPase-activating protein-like [Athene cunicularia]|uniref:T-cell activation Rho GTPase-activating protein-like n=1 Tax=Athene cunicularia TaxID=194338 RepID=UPI000EF6F184|nr:T-cell activation Rho GTPase-activating protein-like [Athene cunicularia]
MAAGATELGNLKEALDRGTDVDLPSQPEILLAAVLKDFLRSIPGKLLVVDLYQDWMRAVERPSQQARVEELRVVAENLPAAHLLLLQWLLPLLQNIGHQVSTSRMTSSNLAICLGPNLLGPPDEALLPFEAMLEVTEKVKLLVEFLIENGSDIFGEEMAGQMSPEPVDRSTELPLEKEHGPAGEADAEQQEKASLDPAPAPLLVLQRAAGGDVAVGAERAEAPVDLSLSTPETVGDSPGCAGELKSLAEHRRFAGSVQKNNGHGKRKREETWEEERPCHQAKKRREEKKGQEEKEQEGAKGAPGADFLLLTEPL